MTLGVQRKYVVHHPRLLDLLEFPNVNPQFFAQPTYIFTYIPMFCHKSSNSYVKVELTWFRFNLIQQDYESGVAVAD